MLIEESKKLELRENEFFLTFPLNTNQGNLTVNTSIFVIKSLTHKLQVHIIMLVQTCPEGELDLHYYPENTEK